MRKKNKVSFLIMLSVFLFQFGFSENIRYIGVNDSLYNTLPAHRGTVQWQYSSEQDTIWKNFTNSNYNKDIFGISIKANIKIRAKITEGNCDIYSDITSVYTTVSDYDKNVYPVKKIGKYVWITENLRTTHYNTGDTIPFISDSTYWANSITPAYCNVRNISNSDSIKIYGRFYNWYTVNHGNLCPLGWHVPTSDEWAEFILYLMYNGYNYDGTNSSNNVSKSLASSQIPWTLSQNIGVPGNSDYPQMQNITQFSAIPVGFRFDKGTFIQFNEIAPWWTSTQYNQTSAYMRVVSYSLPQITGMDEDKSYGLSVRCLKD